MFSIIFSFQIAAFAAKKSLLQANKVKIASNFHLIRLLGSPSALARVFQAQVMEI
jgi:hypothetical protein